jgi:uncharacterized protein
MKKEEAIALAKRFKQKLEKSDVPLQSVYLYGSAARGNTHKDSDIDIAVVCLPFGNTRHEENVVVSKNRWDVDLRIETICLHPEDFENSYWAIPQEVKQYGIAI